MQCRFLSFLVFRFIFLEKQYFSILDFTLFGTKGQNWCFPTFLNFCFLLVFFQSNFLSICLLALFEFTFQQLSSSVIITSCAYSNSDTFTSIIFYCIVLLAFLIPSFDSIENRTFCSFEPLSFLMSNSYDVLSYLLPIWVFRSLHTFKSPLSKAISKLVKHKWISAFSLIAYSIICRSMQFGFKAL